MFQKIIGSNDLTSFLAAFIFALIGVALSLLWHATTRNQNSPNTPVKFSWNFLLSDNVKRIAASLITIFIAIRFYPDLFGKPINEYLAFGVGLGLDKISEVIKNKTNLLDVNRDKIS